MGQNGYMAHSFNFKLACEVPKHEYALILAEGIREFDEEADIHIKESQGDDYWELSANFYLEQKIGIEAYVVANMFEKSVLEVGGRPL